MEDPDKLGSMSEELMAAIKHCLRRGDSFNAVQSKSVPYTAGGNKQRELRIDL